MSETQPRELEETATAAPAPAMRAGLPRWKLVLLSIAGLLVVAGLAIRGVETTVGGDSGSAEPGRTALNRPNSGTSDLVGGASLVDEGQSPHVTPRSSDERDHSNRPPDGETSPWSPALVKGGLSFIIGFSLGLLVRSFIKISAVVVGLVFLSIFGLSYFGIIEGINWSILEGWYDSAAAKVSEEASEFRTFIAGTVPSAGMAGLGIFTGFKKK